jgi:surfeit locus 1 family protein
MTLRFRPLLGFSVLCGFMLAALLWLGVWQLERLQWKVALIADINRNLTLAPISFDRALAMGAEQAQYRRVAVEGRFENSKESYVYTTGPHGLPVYHVLTPLLFADGRAVMIDRGFVLPALRDPETRKAGERVGVQHLVGVWRTPDRPGPFTPPPDLANRTWYARDLSGMAKADGIALAAAAIIEADNMPNPGGWPEGGQTVVNLPNDHLQYAITWFLLALALSVVYLAYHRARGRLGFEPNKH